MAVDEASEHENELKTVAVPIRIIREGERGRERET